MDATRSNYDALHADEVSRLLAACEEMPDPKRIEALLLALLYSGLRISDAVELERSRVGQDGRHAADVTNS